MNNTEIKILSKKTLEDGRALTKVCDILYIYLMYVISIVGLIGVLCTLNLLFNGFTLIGIGFLVITFIACVAFYVVAVMVTHFGKVLVHSSFASLGILEFLTTNLESENNLKETKIVDQESNFDHSEITLKEAELKFNIRYDGEFYIYGKSMFYRLSEAVKYAMDHSNKES